VGQDEDAHPLVRRADFCRAEQTRRRRVAQSPKLSQDSFEAEGDVTGDVFEEDPLWVALADDAGDIGPEVPRIIGAAALSGSTEGLAGISGQNRVEGPAERAGIEGSQVGPDWGWGKIPGALGCDEDGSRPALPFDEAAGVISGFGEHDAQIKASAACAEGQSVPGTKHHAIHATTRWFRRSRVTSPRASIKPHIEGLIMPLGRYSLELTLAA